jgi:hypothetical protein
VAPGDLLVALLFAGLPPRPVVAALAEPATSYLCPEQGLSAAAR